MALPEPSLLPTPTKRNWSDWASWVAAPQTLPTVPALGTSVGSETFVFGMCLLQHLKTEKDCHGNYSPLSIFPVFSNLIHFFLHPWCLI